MTGVYCCTVVKSMYIHKQTHKYYIEKCMENAPHDACSKQVKGKDRFDT